MAATMASSAERSEDEQQQEEEGEQGGQENGKDPVTATTFLGPMEAAIPNSAEAAIPKSARSDGFLKRELIAITKALGKELLHMEAGGTGNSQHFPEASYVLLRDSNREWCVLRHHTAHRSCTLTARLRLSLLRQESDGWRLPQADIQPETWRRCRPSFPMRRENGLRLPRGDLESKLGRSPTHGWQ